MKLLQIYIDLAYSDFIHKLTNLLDNLAPLKKSRVKNNSQNDLIERLQSISPLGIKISNYLKNLNSI